MHCHGLSETESFLLLSPCTSVPPQVQECKKVILGVFLMQALKLSKEIDNRTHC